MLALGTSAYALETSKLVSQTAANVAPVTTAAAPKKTAVVQPTPAAPTPAAAPAPAPKPVTVAPKPKPAANPAASPAAVSATNTSPGNGVDGLTAGDGSTPATPPSGGSGNSGGAPTPCTNTPASYASTNWSGYLKTNCTFTAVSGAWTVPTPISTSTTDTSIDAAWIGIGGVTSDDLIQVGTEDAVATDGTIDSAVFYELLPDLPHYPTSITVSPGDHVSAAISETSTNRWLINITNTTNSKTFSTTVTYSSSHDSAEWIEEDPSFASGGLVPFDDFGTVTFTNASATGNGTVGALADASSIRLVDSHHRTVASPTAVTGAGSDTFSVVRRHP